MTAIISEDSEVVEKPAQAEMPFAIVQGAPFTELPRDLYIPPDALEVFLEAFEGPLDLLLYLIKRQNLDILDIPIADITRQYMEYVDLMKDLHLELAAEYLVMAAMLAEIKSRMLLPRPAEAGDEEEADPRAELIRRLQEYERFKEAAEGLSALPRLERDIFEVSVLRTEKEQEDVDPNVSFQDLMAAVKEVMQRAEMYAHHHVSREPLSVRERMSVLIEHLNPEQFSEFTSLFNLEEGKAGVVVTLLAILELVKESLIDLVQHEPYGSIYVKARI